MKTFLFLCRSEVKRIVFHSKLRVLEKRDIEGMRGK